MNSIDIIQDRANQKNQKQFLIIANSLIIGLLIIWLTLGNLLVAYLEQPMLKAQAEVLKQYPQRSANASETKLRELISKLELYNKLEPEKSIQNEFGDYTDKLRSANNQIISIPQSLKKYLSSQSPIINEIISLLEREPPKFELIDRSKAFIDPLEFSNIPLPSFLNLASLQRVLLAEAVQQYQSGQTQKVSDILTASWNLNLALQENPTLISQLVAQILYADQLAFIRKISLPIEFLQLAKPNYQKSILPAIEFEILFVAKFMQIASSEYIQPTNYEINKRSPSLIERLLLPFQLPYFKLSGIDYWQKNMQMLEKVENQDISLFDPESLRRETKESFAWWNVSARSQDVLLEQMRKPYRSLLEWEFTQKILQAKADALKSGKFPSTQQNTEFSAILETLQYNYQVTENGQKMTIQMQNLPKWFRYTEYDLPITFSFTLNSIKPPS